MKPTTRDLHVAGLVCAMLAGPVSGQTDGTAALHAILHDYPGNGDNHYTVVWVTTSSNQFIRTLWKQGPGFGSGRWNEHFRTWNSARDGDTTVDGYSSATARDYDSSSNNPIDPVWDCRDKDGNLVPDGVYKFWVQYVEEDDGQGPYTTLRWTKGPAPSSPSYPDVDGHFSALAVDWSPVVSAPEITSAAPAATATLGVAYSHTCTVGGTAPITVTASGLPPGLEISATGEITGVPTGAGRFEGVITASNGTAPDASQPFLIEVIEVPAMISTVSLEGGGVLMEGGGPAHGVFTILGTNDLSRPTSEWTPLEAGDFDGAGRFSIILPLVPDESQFYFRMRIP